MNDKNLLSFEERKKKAQSIENYLDTALSHSVISNSDPFLSFIEPQKLNLGLFSPNETKKQRHNNITAMPNSINHIQYRDVIVEEQKELIKDYIQSIIDYKNQEGLSVDEMEMDMDIFDIKTMRSKCINNQLQKSEEDLLKNPTRSQQSYSLKHNESNFNSSSSLIYNQKNRTNSPSYNISQEKKTSHFALSPCEISKEGNSTISYDKKHGILPKNSESKDAQLSKELNNNVHSQTNLLIITDNCRTNNTIRSSDTNNLLTSKTHKIEKKDSYSSQKTLITTKPDSFQREELMIKWKEDHYRALNLDHYNVYDSLSDKEMQIDEIKRVIHPESTINYMRQFFIFLLVLYSIIGSPINIAFITGYSPPFVICDTIADFSFIIDIIWSFFLAYPMNESDDYEYDHKKIALNYISSWALVDLISCLPFNTFSNFKEYNKKLIPSYIELLKMTRFIKYFKLALHSDQINKARFGRSFINSSFYGLIMFFLSFIIFNHILACVWSYIGFISYPSWITRLNMQDESNIDIYFAAMYFNLATIFTVGYGDIVPVSLYERWFNIILQSVGLFLYSFVVSTIMTKVKTVNRNEKFEAKMAILESIKINNTMPKKLFLKITKIIKNDKMSSNKEKFDLINEFPLSLSVEMINSMYKDLIHYKFFRNTNYDFTSRIIMNLKQMECQRGDIMIRENSFVDELIFVKRGILSIELLYLGKIIKISEIRRGEHFGEVNMLLNKKCIFDIVVKSKYASVYLLQRNFLIEIASNNKDILNVKEKNALLNMNLFKMKLKKKKKQIDGQMQIKNLLLRKKSLYLASSTQLHQYPIIHEIIEEDLDNEEDSPTVELKSDPSLLIFENKKIKPEKPTSSLNMPKMTIDNSNIISRNNTKAITQMNNDRQACKDVYPKLTANQSTRRNAHSIRRNTVLLNQNIQEGSLNISEPKAFYTSLFDKINLQHQLKQMSKVMKKIKKQFVLTYY